MTPDMELIEKIQRKQRARASKRIGNDAELVVGLHLKALGVVCLERTTTPKIMRGGRFVFTRKVSGDWRGVIKGYSVLVEVKRRRSGRLVPSDFQPHQWEALREHARAGAISLIAFVGNDGVRFFKVPQLDQFAPLWQVVEKITPILSAGDLWL